MTEDELRRIFEPFAQPEEVKILSGSDGTSKGCGFVRLPTRANGDGTWRSQALRHCTVLSVAVNCLLIEYSCIVINSSVCVFVCS